MQKSVSKTVAAKTVTAKTAVTKPAEKPVQETLVTEPAEKPVEKKETEKPAAAKKTTEKKPAAKKTTTKKAGRKPAAKPAEKVEEIYVQFAGQELLTKEVLERAKQAYVAEGHRESSIKSIRLYIKPEEHMAYYVINEKIAGGVAL